MKCKQISIIFLLFILSLKAKGQNINDYYFQINLASNLANSNKIDSAIKLYESAFKNVNYVQVTWLNKILKLAKLNKDEERIKKYSLQIKTQSKGTSPQLKRIIDSLIIEDQKVRKNKYRRAINYYNDSVHLNHFNEKLYKLKQHRFITDSCNKSKLTKLLIQNNFVGEELVGTMRYNAIVTMLLHFNGDTSTVNLYPLLKKALVDVKLPPIHFANISDKYSLFYNTQQKYWTLPYIGKGKLPFIESDFLPIIKLREDIGIYDSKFWQEKKRGYWLLRNKYNY